MSQRPCRGVCIIPENITVTYLINDNLDYYVFMKEGANLILQSNSGRTANVNFNIWGPGNLSLSCSANVKASLGCAPTQEQINGLTTWSYNKNTQEVIDPWNDLSNFIYEIWNTFYMFNTFLNYII